MIHLKSLVKFERIFDHLPGSYLIMDPDLYIVAVSNNYLVTTRMKRNNLIGKNIFDIFKGNSGRTEDKAVETLRHSLNEVLRKARTDVMDIVQFDIPKPSPTDDPGEVRYWSATNIPVLNTYGNVDYIIHHLDDATEEILSQKELINKNYQILVIDKENQVTSKALQESNNRLRLITDMVPALIGYVDTAHRYKFVNNAYLKYFNTTHKEILGSKIEDFTSHHVKDNIAPFVEGALRGEIQSFNLKFYTHKNQLRHMEAIYLPDINTAGEVCGFVSMIMDVTDKTIYYKELSSLAEEKEKLLQHKDEFIEMASHELRTPLTSIKAYTELMLLELDGTDNSTMRKYLGKTNRYINQLHSLVTRIFDVSTTKTGQLTYHFAYFNPTEMLTKCAETAQGISKKHNIIQYYDIKEELYGDRKRLEQVMTNLLNNAIKYSPHEQDIRLKAKTINNNLEISVIDNGIGIPQKEVDNIFKRFSRATATSFHHSGLGLGLYLSKEIVEKHGGRIWVDTKHGEGSEFHIKLPLRPSDN